MATAWTLLADVPSERVSVRTHEELQAVASAGRARGECLVGYGDGVAVVSLVGEHDLETALELRQILLTRMAKGQGVVVSLVDTTFIDSSILRLLVQTDEKMVARGRRLVLHSTDDSRVEPLLRLSALRARMLCEGSLGDALDAAMQSRP